MSKPSRGDIPFHPIGHDVNPGNLGISIREYFAGLAMQGWLASWPEGQWLDAGKHLAAQSVAAADLLIAELSKPTT